ncbi:hypothetical protein ACM39_12525 [Chryseobacterium sp. FH2]|uniref:phage exclusion protein Lit family protein n=1 Tax=Chryseobacterium sp. FH2 TaxID=1674291 RepID=UPI00065AA943|nr:phage exclusion protein Lit family protein [Chryseobacterium sp. FH2]KMQ67676.1 hypothetical protein ACM39_12525 [Chryseobacterium sp. FH2]
MSTHVGDQPIRVLKHNLIARLEERNKKLITTLQLDLRLDKKIAYHARNASLNENQLPFISAYGTINIHETFLSYIWIICYYFFVVHEEGVVIPEHEKRQILIFIPQNVKILNDAEDLFQYAKRITRAFESWDITNLPNPEYYDSFALEGYYIEKTNDIFVESVNFILYHEIAHAEFEHIKKISTENLSQVEIKALEIDADTRAMELILKDCRNITATSISIIFGIAAILFRKNNLNGGSKHPDINDRLENALRIINPTEDSPVWAMLALFIKAWDKQFNLGLKEKPFYSTYKELFYDLINQV